MEKTIKNLILAGIGGLAYTYEKGTEVIEEMVKKGSLTLEQGKELNEELKRKLDKGNIEKHFNEAMNSATAKEIYSGLNVATKGEIEALKERISKLEEQVGTLIDKEKEE